VKPRISLALRNWIGFDEPRSGWVSLALSSAAILALVLGILVLAVPDYFQNRHCTADGTCYLLPPPVDSRIFLSIGLVILFLAPCLSVAGWRLGNRHWDSTDSTDDPGWTVMKSRGPRPEEVARGRRVHMISLAPDGRTLGKLGVVISILLVLVAVGFYLFLREVFNHLVVY
jgi:hypothetical protein